MNESTTTLMINNLSKSYSNQNNDQPVLKSVSMQLKKKDFLCILGQSGCGKTTLLRCIAGFEAFDGSILVDGTPITKPGTDRIMVFQDFNQLFPWLTVERNISYPLRLQGIKDKTTLKECTKTALEKVKLSGYARYYPHQLSGGMKQRVSIAKALALKPKIILMDEPFAALDAITRRDLQNELLSLSENEDCIFIFVTHNIQEALILGNRILVLGKSGRIIMDSNNPITKPVTPASPGYGELWQKLKDALYEE